MSTWLLTVACAVPYAAAGPLVARTADWTIATRAERVAPSPVRGRIVAVTTLAGAAAAAAFAWRDGAHIILVAHLVLVAIAMLTTVTDLAVSRLPDVLVLPAVAATAAAWTLVAVVDDNTDIALAAATGAGLCCALYLVVHLLNPDGMGFGDVKHALNLGAPLGVADLVLIPIASVLAGVGLLAVAALTRRHRLPFAPALNTATITVLLTAKP
jgi:leader peptidase (prepilin peptidase)/N-methyltransferase